MIRLFLQLLLTVVSTVIFSTSSYADLKEIQERGVLRHLGVPYARFVTGSGDGFSTDLVKGFAQEIGVHYQYVETNWSTVILDLTGTNYTLKAGVAAITGKMPSRGDIIANGLTILPWRQQLLRYSTPTFPSGVWLIASADSSIQPIHPSGDIQKDIATVKSLLQNVSVLSMGGTCLDANLYSLGKTSARIVPVDLKMNEFAPAVINGSAETSLLDVADALIALEKWPGQLKVIGPVSLPQKMAVGFKKTDTDLLNRFNVYLLKIQQNGTYMELIERYYPDIDIYFPDFFAQKE